MVSSAHNLPADLVHRLRRAASGRTLPPANGFTHDGKLNMGPAIWLILALSLLAWGGIIGAGYMLYRLV